MNKTAILSLIFAAVITVVYPPLSKVKTPDTNETVMVPDGFWIVENSYSGVQSDYPVPGCNFDWVTAQGQTPCSMIFPSVSKVWVLYRECNSGEVVGVPAKCYCKKVIGRNRCQ